MTRLEQFEIFEPGRFQERFHGDFEHLCSHETKGSKR